MLDEDCCDTQCLAGADIGIAVTDDYDGWRHWHTKGLQRSQQQAWFRLSTFAFNAEFCV